MSDIKEVIVKIIQGEYTLAEINAITLAVKERQKQDTAYNQAALCIGDKIKLFNLRPKYWNGMQGEIVQFSPQRAKVAIRITDNNNYWGISIGDVQKWFPVSCVAPVGQPMLEVEAEATTVNALHAFLS